MRVGSTYWGLPLCEGLLYWCCARIKSLLKNKKNSKSSKNHLTT
jgi:hypothetical protein